MPDSKLENVTNQIPAPRVDYISRMYPLSNEKSLSRGNSLLSPVVSIES